MNLLLTLLPLLAVSAGSPADTHALQRAAVGDPAPVRAEAPQAPAADSAIYVVYYWRARPGHVAEYETYIRDVAEPIDEEARRAGVFEELRTYVPADLPDATDVDWTHVRMFRLRSAAALEGFSAGLSAAGERVFPDPAVRQANTEHAAGLRDFVRREIWRSF